MPAAHDQIVGPREIATRALPGSAPRTLAALVSLALWSCSAKDTPVTAGGGFPDGGTLAGAGGSTAGAIGGGISGGDASAGGAAAGAGTVGGAGGTSGGGGIRITPVPGSGITPMTIDQCAATNPGGLSPAQVSALKAGGTPGAMRVLYPYEGTVFPRGLGAPTVMWDGAGSDAVYVHLKATNFEYHGCLRANAAGQVQLPQDVWNTAGQQTGGRNDPLSVELTTLSGQTASGPIKLRWVIAQATLKGSIYYNSYNTQLAGGFGNNGAILRLRPGQTAEIFARQGTCTGCHSVSANGERMTTKELGGIGGNPIDIGGLLGGLGGAAGGGIGGGGFADGEVYALTPDTPLNPTPARAATSTSFAGLTPDGKLYLSSAATLEAGPQLQGGAGLAVGDSVLYETDTGTVVNNTGIPTTAMMPTFSADGSLLTFSDGSQSGRAIVVMDFDLKNRKASNPRTVVTDSHFLGWPFVLPDNRAVVFSITEQSDFSGGGAFINPISTRGPASDLALVDLPTRKVMLLAKAIGFANEADANAGKTYLPFGAEELHQHYYPTVSPVAAGGYFWLFFDSVRHYGNLGVHRQLWGAAIAIPSVTELTTGAYESDPSLPAFYLPGQELPVANHRAFTALDPCRKDGAKCETGIDCCNGFCTNGICGRDVMRCSETNEACKVKSDCCKPQDQCIGGFCGTLLE